MLLSSEPLTFPLHFKFRAKPIAFQRAWEIHAHNTWRTGVKKIKQKVLKTKKDHTFSLFYWENNAKFYYWKFEMDERHDFNLQVLQLKDQSK